MNPIRQSIAKARSRVFLQDTLTSLGWFALAAMLAGAIVLVINRLLALGLPWWSYLIPGAVALIAAPLWAYLRRPDDRTVAALIDERLGLKDRLATALYATQLQTDPFAQRVVDDAQHVANGLNIRQGFALKFKRVWGWVPPVAAVVALLAVFVPMMDLLGVRAAKQKQVAEEAIAEETRQQVAEVIAAVDKVNMKDPTLRNAPASNAFKELAELSNADLRDPEMRRNAAAKLSEAKAQLDQTTEEKQNELNAIQNAMSRLDDKPGPADRFTDALRRGDYNAANEELKQLSEQIKSMSDGDKQALQQQLDNLSQQLKQAASDALKQQQQTQQQIQQQLQQAGLNQQQIQQLQKQNFNQQQVQQALQKQGMSQQQAQQTAKNIQQQQSQCNGSKQCQSAMSALSNPLGQMSQSMQNSNNPQGGTPQQQQQQQQQQQAASQASQQLQQMAQMQQQLQQMQQSQTQMQQAMKSMCDRPGNSPGQMQQGMPSSMPPSMTVPKSGIGGTNAGIGKGGNPLGPERHHTGYQTEAQGDIGEGQGKVITSWMENGEMSRGEANVSFDQAITAAKKDAEQALTEDRVPKRYHEAIKDYFDQVPTTPENVRKSAPK